MLFILRFNEFINLLPILFFIELECERIQIGKKKKSVNTILIFSLDGQGYGFSYMVRDIWQIS